jgi:hypothetical protein
MVSVKQAVQSAVAFAQTVLEPDRLSDLRLEEVEAGEVDGQHVWLITLSMMARHGPLASVSVLMSPVPREYKTFSVHKETGEVLGMKIRPLAIA